MMLDIDTDTGELKREDAESVTGRGEEEEGGGGKSEWGVNSLVR
jgi:hypothetical protein